MLVLLLMILKISRERKNIDEFKVIENPPLVIPPDYNLLPPEQLSELWNTIDKRYSLKTGELECTEFLGISIRRTSTQIVYSMKNYCNEIATKLQQNKRRQVPKCLLGMGCMCDSPLCQNVFWGYSVCDLCFQHRARHLPLQTSRMN